MPWWFLFSVNGPRILLKPEGDGTGGGGGGTGDKGGGGDKGGTGDKGGAPDLAKENADLRAQIAAFNDRFAKLEGKGGGGKPDDDRGDDDLRERARREREASDRTTNDTKALETAIRFNLDAPNFLKNNANLLPKDIADIFTQAEKENYGTAKEKADAIKAAVVQSFFSVQSNLDLLTPGVKSQLEDYLKLTKNGKQEKATQIYDTIFEPAFEMLRRVKRAEALQKGHGTGGAADDAYKNKMVDLSRKHFLGETK